MQFSVVQGQGRRVKEMGRIGTETDRGEIMQLKRMTRR